jgi:hypothetical protein
LEWHKSAAVVYDATEGIARESERGSHRKMAKRPKKKKNTTVCVLHKTKRKIKRSRSSGAPSSDDRTRRNRKNRKNKAGGGSKMMCQTTEIHVFFAR